MRHERRARRKQCDVTAALFHQAQLIAFYALSQIIVADFQFGCMRHKRCILYASDLAVAPIVKRLGRGGVVTVTIDDQAHDGLTPESRNE